MANSKNTIQNIPLEAELCMNALKTEVKPFKGYNEKNTTFYGGTLSPIYDKTTELFDKDNSYTFFNSKGEAFTLVCENNEIHLYNHHVRVGTVAGNYVTKTEKLNVNNVDDMIMAAKCPDGSVLSVGKNGNLYIDNVLKQTLYPDPGLYNYNLVDCQAYFLDRTVLAMSWTGTTNPNQSPSHLYIDTRFHVIDLDKNVHSLTLSDTWGGEDTYVTSKTKVPVISFRNDDSGKVMVCWRHPDYTRFYSDDLFNINDHCKFIEISTLTNTITDKTETWTGAAFYELFWSDGSTETIASKTNNIRYVEAARFYARYVGGPRDVYDYEENIKSSYHYNSFLNDFLPVSSVDDIKCPMGTAAETYVYYLNGNVINISVGGRPVAPCLSYSSNIVTPYNQDGVASISYKSGQNWYCFSRLTVGSGVDPTRTPITPFLKDMILDNKYVFLYSSDMIFDLSRYFNIERPNDGWKSIDLSYIQTSPVLSKNVVLEDDPNGRTMEVQVWVDTPAPGHWETQTVPAKVPKTTGVVYGAGVNAGYMISNAELIGYLPNPYIGKVFTDDGVSGQTYSLNGTFNNVQTYFTVGDTTQSAQYKGTDPEYVDTLYPIDPNGNVVLPISQNAEVIGGYSNNDLVKEGNTVYPLMYWNNNQKTYSYMLLSSMENVTDVFSLQGQQYAVDDENIYAINFSSGVISSVNAVAYKKNLTFLGTLPTQAVFWSEFNKTFYAFTGDRTLSRMFEASDIDKINFVGQNPSSLSLWICTDSGVYILSDSDMYKLDFESKQVAFQPKTALVVTEGETNNECHAISLYLNENEEGEMIPVKLKTAYYGLGGEMKAVMDCWYIRLFDKDRTEGYVKVKVNTITDVTRHTEEKTFKVNPSDYDDNNIFYIRYQPKYQECVSMQLELETNLGIYSLALGVNTTDSTAQVSKFNF